ncbi:hypothetical protein [Acidisphaera sp. S103]|uniref:hypothetical protein n=1 Tax=Acidisphaera sp. S103 TaxID=1747223 RepID=UPI00131BDB43|nr:hypothetical protein [Acidisphaera sp. S103]
MSTQKTGRTLFKGGTIVTMDPNVPHLSTGDVLVEGGRIVAVGPNLSADYCRATIKVRIPVNQDEKVSRAWGVGRA